MSLREPLKTFNGKLVNSKRSYSKHTLPNMQLISNWFALALLPRPYIQPNSVRFIFIFISVFFFFLFISSSSMSLSFLHLFFFLSSLLTQILIIGIIYSALFVIVRWIMSTFMLRNCCQNLLPMANLSWLIDFCSAWDHQEILIFWWFFGGILVGWMLSFAWLWEGILVAIPYMIIDVFRHFCI